MFFYVSKWMPSIITGVYGLDKNGSKSKNQIKPIK